MKSKAVLEDYRGQLLVAHPTNPEDNLKSSVILVISYTSNLCIGLQLNKPIYHVTLEDICQNIDIEYYGDDLLYYGGLVGTGKVHVVHSADWEGPSTVRINRSISVTSDISVLNALAEGGGPELYRACAGYWTWPRKLLDSQLGLEDSSSDYRWELLPGNRETVFKYDNDQQWEYCLKASAALQVKYWF